MRFALFGLILVLGCAHGPPRDAASVFDRTKGSVVTVTTPTAVGTGFFIEGGRYLVTCFHVVEGDPISGISTSAEGVRVQSLVAVDADADVAIFRVSGASDGLKLRSTGDLPTGSKVFVIGTPLGFLDHTIAEGILSGVRTGEEHQRLQITAPISPGSSGSPVLDAAGVVVGMVAFEITGGQALNFAISAGDIQRVLQRGSEVGEAFGGSHVRSWSTMDPREIKDPRVIEQLIGDLADDDPDVRSEASQALAALGSPAVGPLIRALSDGNWLVGSGATEALSAIGDPAVGPLIRALADRDSDVRRLAADALGAIKDPRAVEPLIRALADEDYFVKRSAAWALGAMGTNALEPLIRALGDKGWEVRSGAAYALGQIYALGDIKDVRAVEPLLRALVDSSAGVRYRAAFALGLTGDPRAVKPLIRALADSEWDVRSSAAAGLGAIKDPRAVEPLIRALSDESPDVRFAAARALGLIGDSRAVEPLIQALNDSGRTWDDHPVRRGIAQALGTLGDRRALEPLKRLLDEPDEDVGDDARLAIDAIERGKPSN